MSIKNFKIGIFIIAMSIIMAGGIYSHDEGHKRPDTLPPIGPHGGKYKKLTRHYGEVVVKGKKATIYILEKDIKNVADDATRVSALMEIPGKSKKRLKLVKKGDGYEASVNIPKGARRVYFHIKCILDKKWEKGKILYEPRR